MNTPPEVAAAAGAAADVTAADGVPAGRSRHRPRRRRCRRGSTPTVVDQVAAFAAISPAAEEVPQPRGEIAATAAGVTAAEGGPSTREEIGAAGTDAAAAEVVPPPRE